MTKTFKLIGCSDDDLDWMNERIHSDRYRLGPVLLAPFVSTHSGDNPLMLMNRDLMQTLVEKFLPIGDKKK